MMELAALVSALGVHRTKKRGDARGSMATAARLVLGLPLFNILSPTCQTTIRNRRCSTALLVCGYITLFRACSTALHEDER
jgi:hypothetical protein